MKASKPFVRIPMSMKSILERCERDEHDVRISLSIEYPQPRLDSSGVPDRYPKCDSYVIKSLLSFPKIFTALTKRAILRQFIWVVWDIYVQSISLKVLGALAKGITTRSVRRTLENITCVWPHQLCPHHSSCFIIVYCCTVCTKKRDL